MVVHLDTSLQCHAIIILSHTFFVCTLSCSVVLHVHAHSIFICRVTLWKLKSCRGGCCMFIGCVYCGRIKTSLIWKFKTTHLLSKGQVISLLSKGQLTCCQKVRLTTQGQDNSHNIYKRDLLVWLQTHFRIFWYDTGMIQLLLRNLTQKIRRMRMQVHACWSMMQKLSV